MSEWPVKSVDDLATFHRGITWASSQETEKPEPGCVPVLRIPNVQERLDTTSILFLRGISQEQRRRFAATRNWLLMVGSNGNPNRVGDCVRITHDTDYLFASFLVGVEPRVSEGVDPCFLQYLLRSESVRKAVSDSIKGTTGLRNISLSHLAAHRLRCPPPLEQRKIARILTTLDNLIEKTEALIAKYQAIKQGMMHDLFTRGVDEHGHLRPSHDEAPDFYKPSELGWIPKEWDVRGITEIASYQTGQPFPSAEYCDEGIALLRPGNFPAQEYVRWDSDHTTFLPRKWESLASGYLVLSEEVVMNLTAQSLEDQFLGRVCITPAGTRCLLNQRLARFRAKQCHLPFLFWAFKGPHFRFQIDRLTQGTKVQHIYNANLNSARLALPRSDHEQVRIAEAMFSITRSVLAEESQLEKLRSEKNGLMQDLLTGKVRVKVDEAEEVAAHA
jgi:type I restriction enzyme S subunit